MFVNDRCFQNPLPMVLAAPSLRRLGVVRLLTHRLMVMRRGRVVESGLTDQVLDDPQHPYSQLLVSSVLQP